MSCSNLLSIDKLKMGQCLCCDEKDGEIPSLSVPPPETASLPSPLQPNISVDRDRSFPSHVIPASEASHLRRMLPHIDSLVLQTLAVIGNLVENDQETPPSMLRLQALSNKGHGWLLVLHSMVNVIPINEPLGPAVITLVLDDCALPAKDSITKVPRMFWLSAKASKRGRSDPNRHRNICIALGCIAEKLAGPTSVALLTDSTLDYLIANLDPLHHPSVVLFSLIALEKFAQTSENKIALNKRFHQETQHPLLVLEKWKSADDYMKRQVGFCSEWCLDNLFVSEGRSFTYERTDTSAINVMLNSQDVSEYLKIAANGLEARCDASSFESVRCTYQADAGIWYYEALIVTPGIMQIGWATKSSKFLNYEGYGIGDDEYSIAYDGCRNLIWYEAESIPHTLQQWKPGDILGCLLNIDREEVIFSLNGVALGPNSQLFKSAKSGFFAAASFMSFQQCEFNFGSKPFHFAPSGIVVCAFNDHALLTPEQKIILPRSKKLEQLRLTNIHEDSCSLCCDAPAVITLLPCRHQGYCSGCARQLESCPLCRSSIQERAVLSS